MDEVVLNLYNINITKHARYNGPYFCWMVFKICLHVICTLTTIYYCNKLCLDCARSIEMLFIRSMRFSTCHCDLHNLWKVCPRAHLFTSLCRLMRSSVAPDWLKVRTWLYSNESECQVEVTRDLIHSCEVHYNAKLVSRDRRIVGNLTDSDSQLAIWPF